mgnify:CR=1 FL=1
MHMRAALSTRRFAPSSCKSSLLTDPASPTESKDCDESERLTSRGMATAAANKRLADAFARQACADETTFSVKMNDASALEVSAVRGQLLKALDAFYAARPKGTSLKRRAVPTGGEAPKRTLKRFK